MRELFEAIRKACSPLVWSRGVEICRQGGVIGERLSDTEAVFRVAIPDRAASATVKLWPDEEDWLCDCGSPRGPCEHVAGAIIAWRRARERGEPLPVSMIPRGLVVYLFSRDGNELSLRRLVRSPEREMPLHSSLAALTSAGASAMAVNATKEDLTIDSLLAGSGPVPTAPVLARILARLGDSEQVFLDGVHVRIGRPLCAHRIVVQNAQDTGQQQVRVFARTPPEIRETFRNGALLHEGRLCAALTPELSDLEREILARGRVFSQREFPDLVSRILPALERKYPVDIESTWLARRGSDSRPRLLLQTEASGDRLSILPAIVYGEPAYARVDRGKLVLLDNDAALPERNLPAESRLAASLYSQLGLCVGKRLDFRAEAATRMADRLRRWPGKISGNGLGFFGAKPSLEPLVQVAEEGMRVEFRLPGGGAAARTEQVLAAWRDGLARVALDGDAGWAPIPKEWLDRYADRIVDLLEARERGAPPPVHAYPEIARLCEELDTPCPPAMSQLREKLEGISALPRAPVPSDLKATLRPYQQRGVDWLAFLKQGGLGALLADDMGLGKTLQTITVLSGRALVVAPTSVLPNWQKEIARFRPGLKVMVYHGPERKLLPDTGVTLTTYAILRLDADLLAETEWDIVTLDEAQNIKNPQSQVAQAAYRLRAGFRVALTGTPIENRLEDLWSLFHFLNRGLLGGRADFQQRYSPVRSQADPRVTKNLRAKTKPFILRRLKQEVAPELPPRTELVLYCELDAEERNAYEMVRAAARKEVLAILAQGGGVLAALECLLRLRQAACHRGLLPGQIAEDSTKVRLLLEKLEEIAMEGHKALVFSQWTSLLDLIEPHLDASGLQFTRIDGSIRDRQAVVERFQSPAGPPVLLMTLRSAGVGLNLTAADHVFLVDPWWNPAAEDQAADRAHRIGQHRPVFVHRLVTRETVEEKILALQQFKRAAALAALGGADQPTGISRDELLELLEISA